MKQLLRLWRDDRGEVTAVSVILLYTVLGIGVIVGLVCLRNHIVQEFGDLSVALDHLDQSYSVNYTTSCPDFSFTDSPTLDDLPGQPPAGIEIDVPPVGEGGVPSTNVPGESP